MNNARKQKGRALRNAEAQYYRLDNPYLNQEEKKEVELWFQLPGNATLYVFAPIAIWSVIAGPFSLVVTIGIPLVANVIIGLLNWFFYNKNFVYKLYLLGPMHSWILYIVGFGSGIYLFSHGAIVLGILAALFPVGLSPLEWPNFFLYDRLGNRYNGLSPKYAFFKKWYGRKFPFEDSIDWS